MARPRLAPLSEQLFHPACVIAAGAALNYRAAFFSILRRLAGAPARSKLQLAPRLPAKPPQHRDDTPVTAE